jgi:L,D-transpeptidase ErfK/SrfK
LRGASLGARGLSGWRGVLATAWLGVAAATSPAQPDAPALPPLIGAPRTAVVAEGDTLLDVVYAHRLGFDPVARLNPDVKVWIPAPGTRVQLPTWSILPDVPARGLVLNLPEMRLYDFTRPGEPQMLWIAIGNADWPSPVGEFRVGDKRIHPYWYVPESIQRERPELPPVVAPGEDNPLGTRWLGLAGTSYGIHGTHNRWAIGRMATHGCIRLYNDLAEDLYERVPPGTPVRVIYERLKLGQHDGQLFVEVHPDLYGLDPDPLPRTLVDLMVLGLLGVLDYDALDREQLRQLIDQSLGVPVPIAPLQGALPALSDRSLPDRSAPRRGPRAHGDERDRAGALPAQLSLGGLLDHPQLLEHVAQRQHEPGTRRQLLGQGWRDLARRAGHDDQVVGRRLGPASRAVPLVDHDVAVPQALEPLARGERQLGDQLQRMDLVDQLGEDGGLVARAGAHVERAARPGPPGQLRHQRHDVGLADRLAAPDRQRPVVVGALLQPEGDEAVALHATHHGQHAGLGDVARLELLAHHAQAPALPAVLLGRPSRIPGRSPVLLHAQPRKPPWSC